MDETIPTRAGEGQRAQDGVRPFSEDAGAKTIERSCDRAEGEAEEGVGACAPISGVAGFLQKLRMNGPAAFERMQRAAPEVIEAAALPPQVGTHHALDPIAPGHAPASPQGRCDVPARLWVGDAQAGTTGARDAIREAIDLVAATKAQPVEAAPQVEAARAVRSPVAVDKAAHQKGTAKPAADSATRAPTASELEQAERNRGRQEAWKRHKPSQPSLHRDAPGFGAWIDANPVRATDAPSALTSLVDARVLAPALLEPAVPAKLNELAAYYEAEENSGGSVTYQRVEPFADVRTPLKPLTRAERKRMRSDDQRYEEYVMRADAATRRWAAWWRELGESTEHLPPTACPETYAMCRAIVCSREAAEAALHMIGNNFGGNVLWRVMRSAFGDEAAPQWDTSALCARRQIALDLFLLRQSRLKLAGRDKYGKPIMQPCVWGIGRGYIQSLLADPMSKKPLSRERLTHSNDTCKGLFHRGEDARVFVRQSKVPPEVADRDEIGPSGYTFNRYWVARHWNPKRALREEPDGLSAAEATLHAWAWLDRGIQAALRGRFLHPSASVDLKWVARYEVPS